MVPRVIQSWFSLSFQNMSRIFIRNQEYPLSLGTTSFNSPNNFEKKSFLEGEDCVDRRGSDDSSLHWKSSNSSNENGIRGNLIILIILIGLFGWSCFHLGFLRSESLNIVPKVIEKQVRCDPYNNQINHGSLFVTSNSSTPELNIYDVPSCPTLDLITALTENWIQDKNFVKNKTIILFGDSIDRDQLDHLCQWLKGTVTMIHSNHPLSPPLFSEKKWNNFAGSRPYECFVPSIGLRIFSVFHFGFMGPDEFVLNTDHYYPPLDINQRFEQIVVPILKKSSQLYGSNYEPTLISITPGLWSLSRESIIDNHERERRISIGESEEGIPFFWESRTIEQLQETEKRITHTINLIADTFPNSRISYRALHDVKTGHNLITKNRVQNLDQIGRRAVAKLIKEGKKDLDKRLMINEWGSIIRGQEHTYFDFFHPLRNPSSWVYGQVLLNQLKMIAEDS